MRVPFLDLSRQYKIIEKPINSAIRRVLESSFFVLGREVENFEKKFADFVGARYCVGVNSGTDALEISLRSVGIKENDEVITVSYTFIATALSISKVGAKPVFVDIGSDYQMNPDELEKNVNKKTKAILVVHLYGAPAPIKEIKRICKKYNLLLIEDACQAHGATVDGKKVGTFGDVACFSFYPGKNLGAYGDGGAIVTDSEEIAKKCFLLRNYGQIVKYEHEIIGSNSRLDEIQAAILSVKLKYLSRWNKKRTEVAKYYFEKLSGVGDLILPKTKKGTESAFHLFVVRTSRREALKKFLSDKGIQTLIHYPIPAHKQRAYGQFNKLKIKNTEEFSEEILSLPIFPELTEKELAYIVKNIKEFYAQ